MKHYLLALVISLSILSVPAYANVTHPHTEKLSEEELQQKTLDALSNLRDLLYKLKHMVSVGSTYPETFNLNLNAREKIVALEIAQALADKDINQLNALLQDFIKNNENKKIMALLITKLNSDSPDLISLIEEQARQLPKEDLLKIYNSANIFALIVEEEIPKIKTFKKLDVQTLYGLHVLAGAVMVYVFGIPVTIEQLFPYGIAISTMSMADIAFYSHYKKMKEIKESTLSDVSKIVSDFSQRHRNWNLCRNAFNNGNQNSTTL